MLKRVETIVNRDEYIYEGQFDLKNSEIVISSNEQLFTDIRTAVSSSKDVVEALSITEIMFICTTCHVEMTIFPNQHVHFRKLTTSRNELGTCYLSFVRTTVNKYIVCIAFDETQPTLYKAQLIAVFQIE